MAIAESAIRSAVKSGNILYTAARRQPFLVQTVDASGVILLFGPDQWRTSISWQQLEGAVDFLRGRDWVACGGKHSLDSESETLESYIKPLVKRSSANYLGPLLAAAGLVDVRIKPSTQFRLKTGI